MFQTPATQPTLTAAEVAKLLVQPREQESTFLVLDRRSSTAAGTAACAAYRFRCIRWIRSRLAHRSATRTCPLTKYSFSQAL